MNDVNIDALLSEQRVYPPDPAFTAQANAGPGFYDQDPDEFWTREGRDRISWFRPFQTLKEWQPPYARWYLGGSLNVCYNCVDRHVEAGNGDRVAYHWEGEPVGERRDITYADLQREVVRFANTSLPSAYAEAPRSPFTSAWFRNCRSPCSPVRVWVRRTRSCSAASPPTRSAVA